MSRGVKGGKRQQRGRRAPPGAVHAAADKTANTPRAAALDLVDEALRASSTAMREAAHRLAAADPVRAAADSVLAHQGIDAETVSEHTRAAIRPRPVRQQRSQETLDRLLDAAEAVLGEEGLEAATVPRIAARAGVSVGAVYRRFPDKDAVFRAVYGRFFACLATQRQLGAVGFPQAAVKLPQLVRFLVGSMVRSYRLHRGILRSLVRYARTHRDPEFRRHADAMNAAGLDCVEQLLLPYAAEMTHPDPRVAVRTGLYFIGFVLRETVLAGDDVPRLPIDEERLEEELARMYLGYLGVAVPAEGAPPPDWWRGVQRPIRE